MTEYTGSFIKRATLKNLLRAHKRLADSGNLTDSGSAEEYIILSRYLLTLSKQLEYERLPFPSWLKEDDSGTKQLPKENSPAPTEQDGSEMLKDAKVCEYTAKYLDAIASLERSIAEKERRSAERT